MAAPTAPVPIFNIGSLPRIVPVVAPASENLSISGKVRNVPVFGSVDSSGWLVWSEPSEDNDFKGEWLVSPVKKGYRHLRDYYDAERNPEGWAMYQRYVRDWQKGLTQVSFPLHLLPKAVLEMQQGITGADKPDPWRIPAPKGTTGALADVPKTDAPAKGSKGPQ